MNPERPSLVRFLTLSVLAGAAASGVGAAAQLDGRVVATAAVAAVIEADVMWRVAQRQAARRLARVRRILIELVGLLGLAAASEALWSGDPVAAVASWPGGLDGGVIAVWAVTIGVWVAATATLDDLARLGELSDLVDDELLPLPRLRWRYLAVGSATLVGSAVGLTGWSALFELSRPVAGGVLWGPLVYLPVGAVALGRASLADAGKRWAAWRTQVGSTVAARSATSALAAAAILTAVLLLAPSQDGAPAVQAVSATFAQVGRAGEAAVEWLQSLFDQVGSEPTDVTIAPAPLDVEVPEPDVRQIEPGESVIGTETARTVQRLVFWAAVLVAAGVIGRAVWRGRAELGEWIRSLRGLGRWLRALSALPARVFRSARNQLRRWWTWFRRGSESGLNRQTRPRPMAARRGDRRHWEPGDPGARRIVRAYRRFVSAAGDALASKGPAETPAEYAGRVAERSHAVAGEVTLIAANYERVRYAPFVPDQATVAAVESALSRTLAHLHHPAEGA